MANKRSYSHFYNTTHEIKEIIMEDEKNENLIDKADRNKDKIHKNSTKLINESIDKVEEGIEQMIYENKRVEEETDPIIEESAEDEDRDGIINYAEIGIRF